MAFTPSSSGIRKSIRVTSGRSFFQSSTPFRPSPISATTSMSFSCLMIATKPSRTTVWSSATKTRITFLVLFISVFRLQDGLMFQLNENFSSDTLLCANYELAAHPVNSFLHADQTKTAPVVHKAKPNLICTDAQRHLEVSGVRVFDGIREGLLGDAQQTLFVIHRYESLITFCLEFRIEIRAFRHAFEQIVQCQKQFASAKRARAQRANRPAGFSKA